MNERIRLLAEQAEGTKKHVPAVWQFYDHELEKFVELILQDCFDILSGYRGKVIWLNEDVGHNHPILEIRKHFGVK